MSETVRKTQARMAERERRRKQREQKNRLWKTIPFLIVGLLVVAGAGFIIYGNTQTPSSEAPGVNGPRLQLDREQVDLGDRHFNQAVRATFKITNAGDGPLNLGIPKLATVVEGC